MKETLFIISIAIVAILIYLLVQINTNKTEQNPITTVNSVEFSEFGFKFTYPIGPTGYVLEENTPTKTEAGPLKTLILVRHEDLLKEIPVDSEGPVSITISIFNNTQKVSAQTWVDTNARYSNIDLKIGDVTKTSVGGVQAIQYMTDGLYMTKNTAIAYGDNIYLVSGGYIDENSDIQRDYIPLLESITFTTKSNQL